MIPRNAKKAFKSSEKVYFEINLTSMQYLLTIAKCQMLPNKQTLTSLLPPRVLHKLQRHLSYVRAQMPTWLGKRSRNADRVFEKLTMNWKRKRPIWMLLQLTSLNKRDVRTNDIPSLDLFLFSKARKSGKEIGSMESAKEHCGLNNINTSEAIVYLNQMLTKYELARKGKINLTDSSELTYHYICGNLSKYMFSSPHFFINSTKASTKDFEESLKQELLVKRNKNMADKIIKEIQSTNLKDGKRLFFTVGAGHLIGKGGIIDILEARGFKTRHIKNNSSKARLAKFTVKKSRRKKAERKSWKMAQSGSQMQTPHIHSTKQLSACEDHTSTTRMLRGVNVRSSAVKLAVDYIKQTTTTMVMLLVLHLMLAT